MSRCSRFAQSIIWVIKERIKGSASKDSQSASESLQGWDILWWEAKAWRYWIVPPPMSVMRRWRAFCGRGLDWVHARLGPVLRQLRRLARKIFNQRAVQAPATFTACSPLFWSSVTLLGSFCAQDQCSATVQLHDPKNDPFVFVDSLLCSLVTFSIRSITCKMVQNWPWNHLEISLMLINSHSFHGGSKLVGGKVELFEASTDVGRKGSLEKNPYSEWEERVNIRGAHTIEKGVGKWILPKQAAAHHISS